MFYTENGTPCYHEAEGISLIKDVISAFDPEVVVELGTKNGGFTEILQSCTREDTCIYTFDNIKYRHSLTFRDNVCFIVCDILSKPVDGIIKLLSSRNKTLMYCDNGDKTREFELYTKYLKKGDLLGVHDWNTEIFPDVVKPYLSGFTSVRRLEFKELGLKTRFWKRGNYEDTSFIHNVQPEVLC